MQQEHSQSAQERYIKVINKHIILLHMKTREREKACVVVTLRQCVTKIQTT